MIPIFHAPLRIHLRSIYVKNKKNILHICHYDKKILHFICEYLHISFDVIILLYENKSFFS